VNAQTAIKWCTHLQQGFVDLRIFNLSFTCGGGVALCARNAMKKMYSQHQCLCVACSSQLKDGVNAALAAGSSTTLATDLGAASLVNILQGKGRFTVCATTGEAVAHIPNAGAAALPKDKTQLTAGLTYGVKVDKVKTAQGAELTVTTMGCVKVGNANAVKTSMTAHNGVIYATDSVIAPKKSIRLNARTCAARLNNQPSRNTAP
jgi:uncharacterized surface protein with fasciclin (FAS1) repeats